MARVDADRPGGHRAAALVAPTSAGQKHHNTIRIGYCFLFAQLFQDDLVTPLPHTPYEFRGLATGFSRKGCTDDEGVLFEDCLPDDHYEITCGGVTERMELLFHQDRDRHRGNPWALRLRGYRKEG